MDGWTQLGIAGITLGILFFIVRYFVKALQDSRLDSKELTNKFITLAEENIKSHTQLTSAITANTQVTRESIESSKLSSDNLTALILKIVTNK